MLVTHDPERALSQPVNSEDVRSRLAAVPKLPSLWVVSLSTPISPLGIG